jgi:hypothetical protein
MEVPMNDLTPEDQALLERARLGGDAATPEDHARVKRRLFAQVGVAVGTSAVATSGGASAGLTASASAGSTLVGSVGKIVVALAIGAGAGTGVTVAYHARPTQPPPVAPATQPSNAIATIERDRSNEPPTAELGTEPLARAPSREATRDRPASARSAALSAPLPADRPIASQAAENVSPAPAQPAPRQQPVGPATVAAEAELLRQADAALKAGDAARALALLGEHATRFPNGMLIEEREAERIVVLCALGRTEEARAAASQFLRVRPRSPLSQRIRESCWGR